ncbi:ATP-dependent DNA ligase [Aeromicrobium sp. CF4.19]|uniref:ATP-dependent DNA ligase n=1 Tax=Aeromicrobium sp. CF4.19 TaxID=3373082 RepID=UPI003EE454AA
MLLVDLVSTSAAVAATRSRRTKTEALSALLRRAKPDEVPVVTAYLAGSLTQRRTGVGHRSLRTLPDPATAPTLEVLDVDRRLEEVSAVAGAGSQQRRTRLVEELFALATAEEQRHLAALMTGELRQGALEGVLLDAIAHASGRPVDSVRRAAMLGGGLSRVATAALAGDEADLAAFRLEPGRAVLPMLASSAPDVRAAVTKAAPDGELVAVDTKLDGIRIQVHKVDGTVTVFTRSLDDITSRVPEVVEAVESLEADPLVLDGEAIALDEGGRPRPFQETGSRTAQRGDAEELRRAVPLTPQFFDALLIGEQDQLDEPGHVRTARLDALAPEHLRIPRRVTDDPEVAAAFFDEAVAAGHEGVVVKSLAAPYAAGRRGTGWVKVKPVHTLDLVVLAVEWGSGRRTGWLSNLHLGARDPSTPSGFVMLGKTFKGMTDEMLAWQTERFLGLETHREGHVVHVRPEQVVEIAIDGLQASTRYPGGVALRFARVVRHRDDKPASEADTIDSVLALRT